MQKKEVEREGNAELMLRSLFGGRSCARNPGAWVKPLLHSLILELSPSQLLPSSPNAKICGVQRGAALILNYLLRFRCYT